jgi:U3 small nucleolar RNA-associated protein 23
VATQDLELRSRARKIPGTPILYLHHCAPTLEKPSEMSSNTAEAEVEKK